MLRIVTAVILALVVDQVSAQNFYFEPFRQLAGTRAEAVAIANVDDLPQREIVMVTPSVYGNPDADSVLVYRADSQGNPQFVRKFGYFPGGYTTRNAVAVVDLNADGRNDIIVGHVRGISVLTNLGQGDFSAPAFLATPYYVMTAAIIDIDRDGDADIAAAHPTGVSIFRNDAGVLVSVGSIPIPGGGNAADIEIGDLNGDGILDIGVLSSVNGNGVFVLRGNGNGGFQSEQLSLAANSVSDLGLGDINGDRRNDLIIGRPSNSPTWIWLLRQNSSGLFDPAQTISSYDIPGAVESTDLNGDGLQDVLVLHRGWERFGRYMQTNGSLSSELLTAIPYTSNHGGHAFAVGDVTGDDCNDVAIAGNVSLVLLRGQLCTGADGAVSLTYDDGQATLTITASHLSGPIEIRDPVIEVGSLGLARMDSSDCVELASESRSRQRFRCASKAVAIGSALQWRLNVISDGKLTVNAQLSSASRDTNVSNNKGVLELGR